MNLNPLRAVSNVLVMAVVVGVAVFGFKTFQAQHASGSGELATFWIRAASFSSSIVVCLYCLVRGRNR